MTMFPYGTLAKEYEVFLAKDHVMEHFRGDAATHRSLLDDFIKHVADALWPVWDPRHKQGPWVGAAKEHAKKATKAEVTLMKAEFQDRGNPILDTLPANHLRVETIYRRSHEWHYQVEDNQPKPSDPLGAKVSDPKLSGANYHLYNPQVDPLEASEAMFGDPRPKIHGLFDLKLVFQRPRPAQTAVLFGIEDFTFRMGARNEHTGQHPSLISGHAIQGMMLGLRGAEWWLDRDALTPEIEQSLPQYMADFGDRRVFAGVHYPTDNVSSWALAIRLLPHVYRPSHHTKLARILLNAIEQSSVYRALMGPGSEIKDLERANKFLKNEVRSLKKMAKASA